MARDSPPPDLLRHNCRRYNCRSLNRRHAKGTVRGRVTVTQEKRHGVPNIQRDAGPEITPKTPALKPVSNLPITRSNTAQEQPPPDPSEGTRSWSPLEHAVLEGLEGPPYGDESRDVC